MDYLRKTKIVATLGPASDDEKTIRGLVRAGTNICRLNMSHAKHEWVREIVPLIRRIAREEQSHVAVLMDTQGPAIRTGDLDSNLELEPGDIFEFTVRGERSEENYSVDTNYEGLIDDINVGDTVLVDNGVIHMKVLNKDNNRIRCEVLTEGTMGSRRHINLPGVKVNLPALTPKDLEDLALGAELGVDFVALSFVRDADHLQQLREVLDSHDSAARIVAKIEDQQAIRHLDLIIDATDALMVARGDLGIECNIEELPILQRRMVKRCIQRGKPVIVATHMLESMIENPIPTRAEVTDVSNAVYEQADAIMLSGETSVGKYPVKCVEVLDKVAKRIERSGGACFAAEAELNEYKRKAAKSAVVLAESIPGARIMIFTRRGRTAHAVASLRPEHSQIHAFTPTNEVSRLLALLYGINSHTLEFANHPNKTIKAAIHMLRQEGYVKIGDSLIIISDIIAGEERVDSIQHRRVE
jgi:pyruvate kinase